MNIVRLTLRAKRKKLRRKRLKHTAFTICHMFCGWRLINSAKELNTFGSGIFIYDLLTKKASFNNQEIKNPSICFEVDVFLKDELERMQLTQAVFKSAVLNVNIVQTVVCSENRITNDVHLSKNKNPINKGKFYKHELYCTCKLITEDAEYLGEYNDIEEWPENWPE